MAVLTMGIMISVVVLTHGVIGKCQFVSGMCLWWCHLERELARQRGTKENRCEFKREGCKAGKRKDSSGAQ